jgi:hypothetical protein
LVELVTPEKVGKAVEPDKGAEVIEAKDSTVGNEEGIEDADVSIDSEVVVGTRLAATLLTLSTTPVTMSGLDSATKVASDCVGTTVDGSDV